MYREPIKAVDPHFPCSKLQRLLCGRQALIQFIEAVSKYKIVDLPGTYSLSANSDEEVVTRNYISSGEADLVCILADASQLNRSLFMLADYAGIHVPVVLLLNMMDIAEGKA